MADGALTIGELARRTGVAASALRYYEELGLLPPPARESGQRRYDETTVDLVGIILLLRDVGFPLAEIRTLLAAPEPSDDWRDAARRKIAQLAEQIRKTVVARTALEHVAACPHDELITCPNFLHTIAARLAGRPLEDAHPH
jgi:DNA-binding transcriptional MerR regulator